jgi:uncharacterized protein YacL
MNQTILLLRALFLTAFGVAGWYISVIHSDWENRPWLGLCLGLALGLFVILIDLFAKGVSLKAFSSATFGLTLGLVLATLVSASGLFAFAPIQTQWVIRLSIYLTLGYLGTMLALRSNRDEFSLLIPYIRFIRQEPHEQAAILDSSAIIDGRLADLCKSGFLEGTLVIPNFVLKELQNLADSSDTNRRSRGRFGLDLLKSLADLKNVEIKVHEAPESREPVDTQLVRLAQILNGKVVTTDYNLGRVAELQKVKVLNVHILAGISRPQVMSGETVRIKLVKEGKDPHQAVGFLPDGTMIVVNQAHHLIGQEAEIVISSSIQTTAGRMIFADLSRNKTTTEAK